MQCFSVLEYVSLTCHTVKHAAYHKTFAFIKVYKGVLHVFYTRGDAAIPPASTLLNVIIDQYYLLS